MEIVDKECYISTIMSFLAAVDLNITIIQFVQISFNNVTGHKDLQTCILFFQHFMLLILCFLLFPEVYQSRNLKMFILHYFTREEYLFSKPNFLTLNTST